MNKVNAELIDEIRSSIKDEVKASENRIIESLKEIIEERLIKELNPLKEKMSLMKDKIDFYGYQAKGGGTPKEVRRVPGGYGLLEPPSTWRRERYGR